MANIGELTVGIKLNVDRSTAESALKIVELYVNQCGADVIGNKRDDGSISFHYEYGFDEP